MANVPDPSEMSWKVTAAPDGEGIFILDEFFGDHMSLSQNYSNSTSSLNSRTGYDMINFELTPNYQAGRPGSFRRLSVPSITSTLRTDRPGQQLGVPQPNIVQQTQYNTQPCTSHSSPHIGLSNHNLMTGSLRIDCDNIWSTGQGNNQRGLSVTSRWDEQGYDINPPLATPGY